MSALSFSIISHSPGFYLIYSIPLSFYRFIRYSSSSSSPSSLYLNSYSYSYSFVLLSLFYRNTHATLPWGPFHLDDDDYTRTGYPGDGFDDEDGVGTGYMEDDQEEAILGSGSVEPDVEMVRYAELIVYGFLEFDLDCNEGIFFLVVHASLSLPHSPQLCSTPLF